MSANLYITSCPHGLDLRVHPRCYLCKPATPEPPLDEGGPWQWIHDNGFTWDDVNALAAILEAGGYDIVPVAEPPLDVDDLREAANRAHLPHEVSVADIEDLAAQYDRIRRERRS